MLNPSPAILDVSTASEIVDRLNFDESADGDGWQYFIETVSQPGTTRVKAKIAVVDENGETLGYL